jgi:two-component system sensor histidine kinase VanS
LNKKRRNLIGKALSKVVFARFFTSLILFSIALGVVCLGGVYVCSRIIWQGNEFLYPILNTVDRYLIPIFLLIWLAGFVFFFFRNWRKTLDYVDTIANASSTLITTHEEYIHLPPELQLVEDRMNQVKQESVRNARLAKEAEDRKNDLIVYLAHDLKTPLTSIIGYLTLLRDELQISEELREKYLSVSQEKAERLEDLINEFFDITRFNLSELTLELSRVNLTRMLEQITYEFKPLFATKNLTCSLQISAEIELKCDVNKMERVFDNLIRNAVNYSFENSAITIFVVRKSEGVYLAFRNHGNTIPKEKLGRIFEQFYRLDSSRATKSGGAGLGLAIAKEIIELHHGSITAASEKELIEFVVYLPMLL